MPTKRDEQARRMPFDSPVTNLTNSISSSPNSQKSNPRSKRSIPTNTVEFTRSGIPSLNVITNFSSPTSKTTHPRDLSIQQRRKHRQIVDTPKSNPISALSPSDGDLVIGLSLQPEAIETRNSGLNIRKSIAPEIVITPAANLENPWISQKNWRPRSSIYSQATRVLGISSATTEHAPPLPQIPAGLGENRARPLSAASWHTDFSGDEDRNDICRRYSGESQLGILRNASVHTTRRRSEGWWNTILSPIFGRSNTVLNKGANALAIKAELPKGDFLSTDPFAEKLKRESRSSIWTDLSRLDAQRQTLAFFNDSPTDSRKTGTVNEKELTPELTQQGGGFGLASEYFEASWHDAYSTEPYFKCQGHDCSQKVIYRHGKLVGGPDGENLGGGLTEKNLALLAASSAGVKITENAAFNGVRELPASSAIHLRNNSNGTDIDEEPDSRSEMHEAHSKTTSSVGSPMPTTRKIFDYPSRTMTPDTITKRCIRSPPGSGPATPAKALRITGVGKAIEVSAGKPNASARGLDSSAMSTPSRKDKSAPVVATSVALEDPFRDMPYCTSPEALTPGLQKDFAMNKAIPLESTRQAISASRVETKSPPRHDPLAIHEPRRAPLPPIAATEINSPFADPPSRASTPAQPTPSNSATRTQKRYGSGPTTQAYVSQDKIAPFHAAEFRDISLDFRLPPSAATVAAPQKADKDPKTKRRCCGGILLCCGKRVKTETAQEKDKKKKRWYCLIGGALLGLVILILVLVLTLTLHRSDTPVQTQWLNVTGFPPIPTGIATITQPDAAIEESQCVAPNTVWNCALPKEQQSSIAPNQPDQPNFRIEIRFQNGSSSLNSSNSISSRSMSTSAQIGRRLLNARDSFTSSLFNPSPAPPSQEDQIFLGNTTDNNTAPFQGESTPFFISFLPTVAVNSKRSITTRDNSNPFPNVTENIPPPSINSDGTAAAANLLPFPSAQPLMLYNRGRNDEHYGFYTYFDRSIFLKSTDLVNSTGPDIPDNASGGASESAADVRCTWAQTRFLVQIWTNAGNALQLLNGTNSTSVSSSTSSATDFVQPGSFPYPVSITLDRHGGIDDEKMIYCYGMDITGHILPSEKQIHLENRGFGGPGLINPGGRLFGGPANVSTADGGPGGIDGGFGGCKCQWRNWIQS